MTSPNVLVVDDNRDMAEGIAMLLGDAEVGVAVAYSAQVALGLLEERSFDLVLSDVRMPAMSGVELLARIRERWPHTKVVLLTAFGSIDAAVDAMKMGASDYLTKPFDNDALVAVVRRSLAAGVVSEGSAVASIVGDVASVISANDLVPSLRDALDVLLRATGADDGEIFLCEPEGRDLLLTVWSGPDGAALADRPRFALGVGYPGIVASTGEPLSTRGQLGEDPRFLRRAVVDTGVCSFVATPLRDSQLALGSIHLMSRREDFPVDRVQELLQRASVPIANAVRAGLASLRQSVDRVSGSFGGTTEASLRELLESIRRFARARHGTLAVVDARTGCPSRVVSSGPVALVCGSAEAGTWGACPSISAAHGVVAAPGRTHWPEPCRRGLPRRAASPCCLPLVAGGRIYGAVVLDFGREGPSHAAGELLVPLLAMAHQAAIRLQSSVEGVPIHSCSASAVPSDTPPELELRCLGPFTIRRRGQLIAPEAFTRSKALRLLQMLALKAGAPVHREVLIEALWPETAPQLGANRLHGVVHDLRSVLEPHRTTREWLYVRNRGDLYTLETQPSVVVDVLRFRRLVHQGLRMSQERAAEAVTCLTEAAELYRGDLFEDAPFAEWCLADREELKELHVRALERLAKVHAQGGLPDEAIAWLRRASRAAPFRDDLIAEQLELLAQVGRPHEALATYEVYQRTLNEELGTTPSDHLQALRRRLSVEA